MNTACTFEIIDWKEASIISTIPPQKYTSAHVTRHHMGRLQGTETMSYVLTYKDDETSLFVGMGYMQGIFDGVQGCYCLVEHGEFKDGKVEASIDVHHVAPDTALKTRLAHGSYQSGIDSTVRYKLKNK